MKRFSEAMHLAWGHSVCGSLQTLSCSARSLSKKGLDIGWLQSHISPQHEPSTAQVITQSRSVRHKRRSASFLPTGACVGPGGRARPSGESCDPPEAASAPAGEPCSPPAASAPSLFGLAVQAANAKSRTRVEETRKLTSLESRVAAQVSSTRRDALTPAFAASGRGSAPNKIRLERLVVDLPVACGCARYPACRSVSPSSTAPGLPPRPAPRRVRPVPNRPRPRVDGTRNGCGCRCRVATAIAT